MGNKRKKLIVPDIENNKKRELSLLFKLFIACVLAIWLLEFILSCYLVFTIGTLGAIGLGASSLLGFCSILMNVNFLLDNPD